ncbi:MAG: oligosaccharide flippase family protein [Lachnospiraceae bacterium]|nr:oligosaccharide flippase family protein [Lachnospiraceae bacterium]
MKKLSPLLLGTFLLTAAGLFSRFLGFFYRIWLARVIGETSLGLFQMIFPVFGLALSLCTSGTQTAILRFTAETLAAGDQQKALRYLFAGLLSSLTLSVLTGLLLYREADFLAVQILNVPECAALFPVFALLLPPAAVHACISGYYLGRKNATVSAGSQLTEQFVRILVTLLAYQLFLSRSLAPDALLPVIGLVGGEAASFLFVTCAITATLHHMKSARFFPASFSEYRSIFKNLSAAACPLTLQRTLTGVLGSLEAVLLPLALQDWGLTRDAALGIYGIFSGMAMPCILFPSAVTNSMSAMLMPLVAEANVSRNSRRLRSITQNTAALSAAVGIVCFFLFLLFGKLIGTCILGNETAGDYLCVLAWICPFFYVNTTLGSILNGLGRSGLFFAVSILCSGLRLTCVLILVPAMGIHGHLLGMLISTILQTLLNGWAVSRAARV